MTKKRIIVIGAGIAGLSAGIYSQMNGYDSEIFELNHSPGGLCTSWTRKGYTFDGCLDWLTGSAPDGMMYPLWEEVGAIQNNHFLYENEYCRYVDTDGYEVIFHLDIDKLEKELLQISKDDSDMIAELCDIIRTLKGFKPMVSKAMEVMNPIDYIKFILDVILNFKKFSTFLKYGKISMGEYSLKFKSERIKKMLSVIWNPEITMALFASIMAWCSSRTAGFPQGGSLKFAKDIEKRYLELGGTIHYNSKVDKISVIDHKVNGITLSKGDFVPADMVISCSDGYSTIYNMLGGKYLTEKIVDWYSNMTSFPPYIQISFGVNRDMSADPRLRYLKLDVPLKIAEKDIDYMILHNYSFDKTLAPEGKTSFVVRYFSDFTYWQNLYKDIEKYNKEKENLANITIQKLENLYPRISDQIETIDVATPTTYVRYTETWRGATMSWLPTAANFGKNIEKTIPGLADFYMAGQWLIPGGGVPNALKTSRDVLQIICKKDKKCFTNLGD